jgi:predicted ribosome quality control (RQC) complex YloA/Tae2 family protein
MGRANFSNFDVFAISKELDPILAGSSIANVYEVEDLLILKINTRKEGRKNLIIQSDSRINLTDYDYPIPKYPSQYIMSLRKFLKNRRILSVTQYNFDRIIIIELTNIDSKPWKFLIELFNKGNFLLLDENDNLKIAKKYRKFKDRDVLAGKEFIFPKSRGKDFLTINQEEFKDLVRDSDAEIVRTLARNINIAGLYSEEVCLKAGIDKKKIANELNNDQLSALFKAFKNLRNQFLFGDVRAYIVLDDDGVEINVLPFELESYTQNEKKYFPSFNSAVDEFYSKIDTESLKKPKDHQINQRIKAQEKILNNQLEYMEELKKKKKNYYKHGDFIYSQFNPMENLLNVILSAKAKGYSWEEINDKLESAKLEKLSGAEFFKKIIPATKKLIIKINNDEVYLDLNKTIGENANIIYAKGKKAEKKILGTIPAIEQTRLKIKKLNEEKELIDTEVDFLIKKPKKKWYEKFHWFETSDDFLVIGGRDATSNEIVFKKYLDSNDLVFHTNFPGSPLTIIKNPENKEISEASIKETAEFVASYSRAWKETWGIVDVFYVQSDQVSKTPPTGEFLPKGSFMISGKKQFIKNAKTELAICLEIVELESNTEEELQILYPKIVCGPKNAIKSRFNKNILLIKPSKGGLSKGKVAKEIKSYFIKNATEELKKWIKLLSLDDIILSLPTGASMMKESN